MMNPSLLPEFSSLKKVHILGVGGTLMGAFAAFLKRRGIHVTGSDLQLYPPMSDVLQSAGVQVYSGYRPENLTADSIHPDLVIIGNVIRADNPEAQEAMSGRYHYSSLPEAMEKLLLEKTTNLVVAGTHGKTTTSSLLAFVLEFCQQKPSYFIGGVSPDLPQSFYLSEGHERKQSYFVLEGDEYDTAFWDKVPKFNHYLPDHGILTSIEYDHADIYPDMQAVIHAFEGFVRRIRKGGHLIACYDYPHVQKLAAQAQVPVFSYGSHPQTQAQFTPARIRVGQKGLTFFDVIEQGRKIEELALQLTGLHNVLNALAVWIECRAMGLDLNQVKKALQQFQGVKRRQEVRGVIHGVTVIDDFAHHPTAVRETLRALRLKYAHHRLITIFEPRSATSRRKVFQKDYVEAFQEADQVWIATPFDQSRIAQDDQFSSEMLVADLSQKGKSAYLLSSVDSGVKEIAKKTRQGDLVAVLSNGGFDGFIPKLLNELKLCL